MNDYDTIFLVFSQLADIPEGCTPLHAAAMRCHPECFQMLLEYDASVDIRDGQGLLAFDVFGLHAELEQEVEHDTPKLKDVSRVKKTREAIAPRSVSFSFAGGDNGELLILNLIMVRNREFE